MFGEIPELDLKSVTSAIHQDDLIYLLYHIHAKRQSVSGGYFSAVYKFKFKMLKKNLHKLHCFRSFCCGLAILACTDTYIQTDIFG